LEHPKQESNFLTVKVLIYLKRQIENFCFLNFLTEKGSCWRHRHVARGDFFASDGVDQGDVGPIDGDATEESAGPHRRGHGQEQRRLDLARSHQGRPPQGIGQLASSFGSSLEQRGKVLQHIFRIGI